MKENVTINVVIEKWYIIKSLMFLSFFFKKNQFLFKYEVFIWNKKKAVLIEIYIYLNPPCKKQNWCEPENDTMNRIQTWHSEKKKKKTANWTQNRHLSWMEFEKNRITQLTVGLEETWTRNWKKVKKYSRSFHTHNAFILVSIFKRENLYTSNRCCYYFFKLLFIYSFLSITLAQLQIFINKSSKINFLTILCKWKWYFYLQKPD